MRNDIISEIYKAGLYAKEQWRVVRCAEGWLFQGDNHTHFVQEVDGQMSCDCESFRRKPEGAECCAHTRAIERMGLLAISALRRPMEDFNPHLEVLALAT